MEGVPSHRTLSVVPFSVDADVHHLADGIMGFSGSIAYQDGAVELRYRGNKVNAENRRPARVRIALDQIKRIEFERRWIWSRLILEAGVIDAFERIPFANESTLTLSVARKDRRAATDFMAVAQTRLDFPERP